MATNAAGNYIPPMIIYEGKRMLPELEKDFPPGTTVRLSESGYFNNDSVHLIQFVFRAVRTLLQTCKKAGWQDFIGFRRA